MQTKVYLGKLGKTKGLRGELKLYVFNPNSTYCEPSKPLWIDGQTEPLVIRDVFAYQDHHLVAFEGRDQVEDVKPLVGKKVYVFRDQLTTLDQNEFYHVDLIGCQAIDQDTGHVLGVVTEVLATGANDVLVVQNDQGEQTLVAFHKDYVGEVNLEQKTIQIKPFEVLA